MRKPAFCICKNKDADQLRDNREADQCLCVRYSDSTIPLLPESEISSLWPSSEVLRPGLCRTWLETPKTGFLTTRLIFLRSALVISELKGATRKWGLLQNLDRFDATFFGIPPKQANLMDPQLRFLLEATYEALIDAGKD